MLHERRNCSCIAPPGSLACSAATSAAAASLRAAASSRHVVNSGPLIVISSLLLESEHQRSWVVGLVFGQRLRAGDRAVDLRRWQAEQVASQIHRRLAECVVQLALTGSITAAAEIIRIPLGTAATRTRALRRRLRKWGVR